jgi:predicted porin
MAISNLSLEAFTGYKITKKEHFFLPVSNFYHINNTLIADQWLYPGYEDTQTFKLGGNIHYFFSDIVDVRLNATYYKWFILKEKDYYEFTAWHKPDFETDLTIGLQLIPRLRFDLLYHLETGRKVDVTERYNAIYTLVDSVKMKNIHDLSFKGTYSINKTISTYVTINNLLFQKYDLWYGYPNENFNIMVGISVKF